MFVPLSSGVSYLENPSGDVLGVIPGENAGGLFVAIIVSGTMECMVGQSHYYLSAMNIAILPESTYLGKMTTSGDFKGYVVRLEHSFLDMLHNCSGDVIAIQQNGTVLVKSLSKADLKTYKMYISALVENAEQMDQQYSTEISSLVSNAFFFKVLGQFKEDLKCTPTSDDRSRKNALAKQFITLVQENCTNHRDLDFYADQLCITSKYLSHVVSKSTGKKALRWIEDCVMAKAMQMLKNTDYNINQISDSLNFQSPSDFCRSFKKVTNMTPRTYRNSSQPA